MNLNPYIKAIQRTFSTASRLQKPVISSDKKIKFKNILNMV